MNEWSFTGIKSVSCFSRTGLNGAKNEDMSRKGRRIQNGSICARPHACFDLEVFSAAEAQQTENCVSPVVQSWFTGIC